MRYNTVFNISKEMETETKFEVVEFDVTHNRTHQEAKKVLDKKYPDCDIEIIRVTQAISANGGIV